NPGQSLQQAWLPNLGIPGWTERYLSTHLVQNPSGERPLLKLRPGQRARYRQFDSAATYILLPILGNPYGWRNQACHMRSGISVETGGTICCSHLYPIVSEYTTGRSSAMAAKSMPRLPILLPLGDKIVRGGVFWKPSRSEERRVGKEGRYRWWRGRGEQTSRRTVRVAGRVVV